MEKTLREVCDELGVSRRAVQGYEKAGLVSATDKTNRGYLLYDEEAQEKIRRIKMYQDVEFSLKEIAQLLDASAEVVRFLLLQKQRKLRADKDYQEKLIQKLLQEIENC